MLHDDWAFDAQDWDAFIKQGSVDFPALTSHYIGYRVPVYQTLDKNGIRDP